VSGTSQLVESSRWIARWEGWLEEIAWIGLEHVDDQSDEADSTTRNAGSNDPTRRDRCRFSANLSSAEVSDQRIAQLQRDEAGHDVSLKLSKFSCEGIQCVAYWRRGMWSSGDLRIAHGATPSLPRLDRLQRLDPLEERTDGEVVGERLLVVTAGNPDFLAVGSVQPGVVPYNRPGRGGLAPLGRADRWALLAAHRASLAGA
jgi:hypothetical protein